MKLWFTTDIDGARITHSTLETLLPLGRTTTTEALSLSRGALRAVASCGRSHAPLAMRLDELLLEVRQLRNPPSVPNHDGGYASRLCARHVAAEIVACYFVRNIRGELACLLLLSRSRVRRNRGLNRTFYS